MGGARREHPVHPECIHALLERVLSTREASLQVPVGQDAKHLQTEAVSRGLYVLPMYGAGQADWPAPP